jgi:hypothetical protein
MNFLMFWFSPKNLSKRLFWLAIAVLITCLFPVEIGYSQKIDSSPEAEKKSSANGLPPEFAAIANQLFTPTGGIIAACAIGMVFLSINGGGNSKNKLANAHWANGAEIAAARKKAKEQINRRERNKLSLFIVKPKLIFPPELISRPGVATPNHELPITGQKPKVIQVSQADRTIWLPDANRGIAVLGGTGSG